jgi:hypothetical protein
MFIDFEGDTLLMFKLDVQLYKRADLALVWTDNTHVGGPRIPVPINRVRAMARCGDGSAKMAFCRRWIA